MKKMFILCESTDTYVPTHVICITQPTIYALPAFDLVSGSNDAALREEAIRWFANGRVAVAKPARSIPHGYLEALDKVRQQRNQVNIAELAEAVGISEKFMTHCIDDIKWKGAITRMPMAIRQKFIDAVAKLEFTTNHSGIIE